MDSKFIEICQGTNSKTGQGTNSKTGQGTNSKTGQGTNLLPTIKEADQADHLFIGGRKKLMQWSISQQKVTKDFGNIMASAILSMVQTSDKKYLFFSDDAGY
jgi:WD40 repeat protein